ncbi:MAG TPA: DUF3501 family protein [Polyangiaceae bacterium]|nr:DUF3501 family protein [Polyangiaceae bacterium]
MKKVERGEVLDLGAYEEIREAFRRRIIEEKRNRRIALGSNMTVLFENHDTALYQIQEMLRTERITREDAVLHEIETYNELVPGPRELSATIFVEYPEKEERDRMLVALAGLEDRFYVEVGGERQTVRNDTKGVLGDRTTAVHYTRVLLTEAAETALRGGKAVVSFGVDHPAYAAQATLPPRAVEELARDLAG